MSSLYVLRLPLVHVARVVRVVQAVHVVAVPQVQQFVVRAIPAIRHL